MIDRERMAKLAGIVNESVQKPGSSEPIETRKTADGRVVGTFKEGHNIYIKESRDGKNFDFIGGYRNRHEYSYNSVYSANQNMDFMVQESYAASGMGFKNEAEGDEDLDFQDKLDNASEPDTGNAPPESDEPEMDAEPESEAEPEADVDVDVDVDAEEDFADDPEADFDAEGEGDEAEGGEGEEADVDIDVDAGDEDGPMVHAGKAQNHIQQIDAESEDAESALKQVLSGFENAVEGSALASGMAAELKKLAAKLDATDEARSYTKEAMEESKRRKPAKRRRTLKEMRRKRKSIKENVISKLSKKEVGALVEKHNIMQKPSIKRKRDHLKALMEAIEAKEMLAKAVKSKKKS